MRYCRAVPSVRHLENLEKRHEPSRQKASPPRGRSPERRASLPGLAHRAAAGVSTGQETVAACGASRAKTICAGAGEGRRRAPAAADKVQTVVVTADEANMRVDRFLEARFPGLSFSHIQRIVRKGELRVNGKRADSKDRLEEGRAYASRRSSWIRRRRPARCRRRRRRRSPR